MRIKNIFKILATSLFGYIVITGDPTRDSDTSVAIPWEYRDDADTVLNSGKASFQFLRADATDDKGNPLTSDDRAANLKQQFYDWAISYVKRAEGGDNDFLKIITQLNGMRVP